MNRLTTQKKTITTTKKNELIEQKRCLWKLDTIILIENDKIEKQMVQSISFFYRKRKKKRKGDRKKETSQPSKPSKHFFFGKLNWSIYFYRQAISSVVSVWTGRCSSYWTISFSCLLDSIYLSALNSLRYQEWCFLCTHIFILLVEVWTKCVFFFFFCWILIHNAFKNRFELTKKC